MVSNSRDNAKPYGIGALHDITLTRMLEIQETSLRNLICILLKLILCFNCIIHAYVHPKSPTKFQNSIYAFGECYNLEENFGLKEKDSLISLN